MIRLGALALGVIGVVAALSIAWGTYGSWPVPDGYSFPRHSMYGGPLALYVGALEDSGGCIRTAGGESFAVVWPPGYRLSLEGGRSVVQGGGRAVHMGDEVRMGGGFYEDGQPPPGSRDTGGCAPPFFLATGFAER